VTRGRGRDLDNTALSGTLPSDIGNLEQLGVLCAPRGLPPRRSPPGLTRGRGRWLYDTALSGTLPSEIGKLQLDEL
jgi:hypothetical protein